MNKKLYKLMNWADIEGVVYSEEDNPHRLLGPHNFGNNTVVQFFYPGAVKATLYTSNTAYEMELADENGYFAVLIPKKEKLKYTIEIELDNGTTKEIYDPYSFQPQITQKDIEKFSNGIHYNIYEILGSHPKTINGIKGIYFAVWAPNAIRVSVVGDFNSWDGRIHQMRRLYDSGIFEIFIPCANINDNYKYEIKAKGGKVTMKADPYASYAQLRPETASIVYDISGYNWTDEEWISKRSKFNSEKEPISVYEVHLGSFRKPDDGNSNYTYRDLAPMIIRYVKEMGYTHIELLPIMEYPNDNTWGYQSLGFYAPTSRYGTPEDFMFFMNEMHKHDIGVILDWSPSYFPKDIQGFIHFDGTSLYEHSDSRRSNFPEQDALFFDFTKPQVCNYLLANALYWVKEFHADGIRLSSVASMLYLDYGKTDGEWLSNLYGGNENLEAIDFLKHLNSIIHKQNKGVMMIAEESAAWPMVTQSVCENGLGFDLKWNLGWIHDFTDYMQLDPFFRGQHHGELTFSMIYAYVEKYMLAISHNEVVNGKTSMIRKMPGELPDKFKNLRAAYGFMMMHPGKKMLFMGQDIAEFDDWNEKRSIEWDLLETEQHKKMQEYVKALNKMYTETSCLYAGDNDPEGFEWVNSISANENVIVFLRKATKETETLLIVCNFANEKRDNYKVGVPYPGKYKEILNSDSKKFGGDNVINVRAITSKESECDNRENSIQFKMPALSIQVFAYTPFTAKEKAEIERLKEEERQKNLELARFEKAKEAETEARRLAEEAKNRAKKAQEEAKEALKKAMEEAKRAEELEKAAQDLENEALAKQKERAKVKEEAKFI